MVQQRRDEAGFSLLEIVIAAGLLALVMMGVLAAMNGAFLADRAAANSTRSQAIARQTMEECMAVAFDDLMNLDGNVATVDGYTVRITVVQSSVDTRLIEVLVEKANEPGSRTRLAVLRSAR